MFKVVRHVRFTIILFLSVYNTRGVTAFRLDASRRLGFRHLGLSTTFRQHGATVIDFDTALTEKDVYSELSIRQDIVPKVKAEPSVHLQVGLKINATQNVSHYGVVIGWMDRFRQLREFKDIHGHTMVPKRYKGNPSLGNWVSKQRQLYHNFQLGTKPCSLTNERIDLLNQLNFCWNATSSIHGRNNVIVQNATIENEWWSRYEELCTHCQQHGNVHDVMRQTRLGTWLDLQRKAYEIQNTSDPARLDKKLWLSDEKLAAMSRINEDWWMTRRQWQWEMRYRDLQEFAHKYGHCCVPISYSDNKQLAHWVSNQRKLYNLRIAGKRSEMTVTRIQKLEAIGFVWNRWDYEFSKKQVTSILQQ